MVYNIDISYYIRFYHALQLKLVEAAEEGVGDDTDDELEVDALDGFNTCDAGDDECKDVEDEVRGRAVDGEEAEGTSPSTDYRGHLVTIKSSWFSVAWAKKMYGDDYTMTWSAPTASREYTSHMHNDMVLTVVPLHSIVWTGIQAR